MVVTEGCRIARAASKLNHGDIWWYFVGGGYCNRGRMIYIVIFVRIISNPFVIEKKRPMNCTLTVFMICVIFALALTQIKRQLSCMLGTANNLKRQTKGAKYQHRYDRTISHKWERTESGSDVRWFQASFQRSNTHVYLLQCLAGHHRLCMHWSNQRCFYARNSARCTVRWCNHDERCGQKRQACSVGSGGEFCGGMWKCDGKLLFVWPAIVIFDLVLFSLFSLVPCIIFTCFCNQSGFGSAISSNLRIG